VNEERCGNDRDSSRRPSTEAASGKRSGIAATPQTIVTSDLYIYTYPAMREVDLMEYERLA